MLSWEDTLEIKYKCSDVKEIKKDTERFKSLHDKYKGRFYLFFDCIREGKQTIIALENKGGWLYNDIELYDLNLSDKLYFASEWA